MGRNILSQYNLPQEAEILNSQTDILSEYNALNMSEVSCYHDANALDMAESPVPGVEEVRIENNYEGAMENIARMVATKKGEEIMSHLISTRIGVGVYKLKGVFWADDAKYDYNDNYIYYVANPWGKEYSKLQGGGAYNSWISMGHEFFHAYDHYMREFRAANAEIMKPYLERRAVSFGNHLRQAYSLSPLREGYGIYKGNFHQFPSNEEISDFTKLGNNADKTSYGFSWTKTTTFIVNYKTFEKRTETTNHFIIVSMDKNNNNKASYKLFNDEETYKNATSNW
jgi:hypothetical protein